MRAIRSTTWQRARRFCLSEQSDLLHVFSHKRWEYIDDNTEGYLGQFDGVPIGLTCERVCSIYRI